MQKPTRSPFITWLIRGLLTVLLIVFLTATIWYLQANNVFSYVSDAFQLEPTATPVPVPVVRLNDVILSKDMRVIKEWTGEQIPELIAETDTLYTGYTVDGEGINETVKFISALSELHLAVTKATLYNEDNVELLLQDGVIVRYAARRDPVKSAYTIQEMYSIFTIEGKLPSIIDMRFEKPVIIN